MGRGSHNHSLYLSAGMTVTMSVSLCTPHTALRSLYLHKAGSVNVLRRRRSRSSLRVTFSHSFPSATDFGFATLRNSLPLKKEPSIQDRTGLLHTELAHTFSPVLLLINFSIISLEL